MMTFNEKHLWIFPLVPTAWAYSILSEYFWKIARRKIEVPKARGDFGDNLSVREVFRSNRRVARKWGVPKRRFRKWGTAQKHAYVSCNYYFGGVPRGKVTR